MANFQLWQSLQNTGDVPIVWASKDRYWGCGLHHDDSNIDYLQLHCGENNFGNLLIGIRDQLRNQRTITVDLVRAPTTNARYGQYSINTLEDHQPSNQPLLATPKRQTSSEQSSYVDPIVHVRSSPTSRVQIGEWTTLALIDTGATFSAVQKRWLEGSLGLHPGTYSRVSEHAVTIGRQQVPVYGTISRRLQIAGLCLDHEVSIIDYDDPFPAILGYDFLKTYYCSIDAKSGQATVNP